MMKMYDSYKGVLFMIRKKELSKGSITSINLAIENPEECYLTDDDNARLYALNIGLNVMSTTRVISDAVVEGEIKSIEEMKETLYKLKEANCKIITDEIITDIIKVVKNRLKERDENIKNEKQMDFSEKIRKTIEKIESTDTPQHPFNLFGIEHGYGWYGLTLPIIEEVRLHNIKNPGNKIQISQIKEKFGSLRIYLSSEPEYLEKMILKAEHESEKTCEICGAKGTNKEINGWYMTLCEEHRKAKLEANYDHDLEDRLYKKMLNIENYGWKISDSTKEDQNEK